MAGKSRIGENVKACIFNNTPEIDVSFSAIPVFILTTDARITRFKFLYNYLLGSL